MLKGLTSIALMTSQSLFYFHWWAKLLTNMFRRDKTGLQVRCTLLLMENDVCTFFWDYKLAAMAVRNEKTITAFQQSIISCVDCWSNDIPPHGHKQNETSSKRISVKSFNWNYLFIYPIDHIQQLLPRKWQKCVWIIGFTLATIWMLAI